MDPGVENIQDISNYYDTSRLSPGISIESGPTRCEGGYASRTMATTSGVLIRHRIGEVRPTVANHGFLDTDDVYYPHADVRGVHIGEVTECFDTLGIALVKLYLYETSRANTRPSLEMPRA